MKPYLSPKMLKFMQVNEEIEEAIDQPVFHYISAASGIAGDQNFFGVAKAAATNGLADTNLDQPNQIGSDTRMIVRAISVHFISGSDPAQATATTTLASAFNDAKRILEGVASFVFTVGDKPYLQDAPLAAMPAGLGVAGAAGGIQRTQASAADGTFQVSYGSNGLPTVQAVRQLVVPLALWPTAKFSAKITFPTAGITLSATGRLGVRLWGMQIRPKQ